MAYSPILGHVFAGDRARAVRFYAEAREMPLSQSHDEVRWAQLDTADCRIALE